MSDHKTFQIERSALLTIIGIIILFSSAIGITLIAPTLIEKEWTAPSSVYQVQMYEVADPMLYISNRGMDERELEFVYSLQRNVSLLAFREGTGLRIVAPRELEPFITKFGDETLKLTSQLMLLRKPEKNQAFDAIAAAETLQTELQLEDEQEGRLKLEYEILELYLPGQEQAFAIADTDGVFEDWVDQDFVILDTKPMQPWHTDPGVIFVNNPREFHVQEAHFGEQKGWRYDPDGEPIANLEELRSEKYGFISRKELIDLGEDIYRIEGCWYCHTDQTRTLVQDLVLNGSDDEPAPPSTPNEYIYNHITFPGTRRIGPDLSRTGVKRPSRDWHMGHFWSPKTESKGSIMPAFRHFFDDDPRGTSRSPYGVPNYQFEAIYQYLMTKGTRITAPTQAWWTGRDPIQTKAIIEGKRHLAEENDVSGN